jgi:formylglycine-generating enzyme required for sulfatase activity
VQQSPHVLVESEYRKVAPMAFFSTTALGPGSPIFRGRSAELTRLQQLCHDDVRRYGVVYGGRQNGKTSLLFQLQNRLLDPTKYCRIDFQQIQGAAPERVFTHLATLTSQRLATPLTTPVVDGVSFRDYLNLALASHTTPRFVLLLDELGALPVASREALGNAVRSFFHDRLVLPALQKLQVIFSGGVELYTMVVSEVSSLHSVCEEIYLPDLPKSEAVVLIAEGLQGGGVPTKSVTTLGQAVYTQVTGHPYLTQRMGELLLDLHATGTTLDSAAVAQAAAEISNEAPILLRRIRDDLQKHHLEKAARQLLREMPRFSRLNDPMHKLELIGLAKKSHDGRWVPRNPLLAEVFSELLGVVLPPAAEPTSKKLEPTPIRQTSKITPSPKPPLGARNTARAKLIPALVQIPAGPFLMGSSTIDPLAEDDEKPQHRLVLPDFWIGETPITNAQFRPFVAGDGYTNPAYWTTLGWQWRVKEQIHTPAFWGDAKWNGADYPVVGVSWYEAVAYCRWLSAQTGHPFRLPSEAEWEKAARGPSGRIWPWGNTWQDGRCNYVEHWKRLPAQPPPNNRTVWSSMKRWLTNDSTAIIKQTTPVTMFPEGASPYGALDMVGNVWEWCATKHGKPYPYQLEDEWNDAYLAADTTRCLRGGSWYSERKSVRGAVRTGYFVPCDRCFSYDGLRVASHAPLPNPES